MVFIKLYKLLEYLKLNFMEQKILDELLMYLKDTKQNTFQLIKNDVKNKSTLIKDIDDKILYSALLKLVKDEYVSKDILNIGPYSSDIYTISFEGIFFINKGGYAQVLLEAQRKEDEYENLNSEQKLHASSLLSINRRMVYLTWAIAIGTLISAIYYLLEILHFFGVYFDISNYLFCIKP